MAYNPSRLPMEQQRLASSFAPGSSQPRVSLPPPHLSFHDYGRAQEDMEKERYHGRIDRGIRFWNLKPAKTAEIQPVCQLLDRWHEIYGERPPYIMAFVNTGSGNRKVSQAIKDQLEALLNHRFQISGRGEEEFLAGHVCELANRMDPKEEIRQTMMKPEIAQLRFLVCGGDGTVTWVLHEIEECKEENPRLFSNFQEESLHAAQPRHGQPLSLHAMRTAAARRGTGAGAHRRRSSARYQMFDVVARPLQDLRKLQSLRRRSLVRPEAPEASEAASAATSRRTTEVGATPGHPAGPPARQMTVNIGKLSKELAKRWTNVTSQEVEHRRMEMEKLKEEDGDVNLDSFFEYDVMRTASNHSEGHGGHTAVPGSQVDQRMASRRRSKGAQMSEAAAAAQLKVQKHLAQLRNWHSTGRAPTSPVPLPVLVPKEASKVTESKAKELRKEKSLRTPGAAKEDGQEMPMSAVNSADQYMKGGFKDADLNRLLEQISQTDTFPEGGEDFVWAPPRAAPRKVPLPQLSRGESWIKAIVRGDSPYLDLSGQEAPKPRRGRSPEEAGVS